MARPLSPLPLNGPAISGGNLFAASLIEADTFCLASFEIEMFCQVLEAVLSPEYDRTRIGYNHQVTWDYF